MANEKIYSVTIETIDQAIKDWLDFTVDSHVQDPNGERKKVPVVFASGERWVTSRTKKALRDKNGVIILPVISLKRVNVNPDASKSALGIEVPYITISKQISKKTSNLQNINKIRQQSLQESNPIVYEVTSIPYPNRTITSYEVTIQAQYITQMNSIVEKIVNNTNFMRWFVAPFDNKNFKLEEGHFEDREKMKTAYVVGTIDDSLNSTDNFEEFTDQERIIKHSFSIKVPTVYQLDPEGTAPPIKVERTSFGLSFGKEEAKFVDDPEELELIFSIRK